MATTDMLWAVRDGRGLEHLRLSMDTECVLADTLPSPPRGEGDLEVGHGVDS